MQKQDAYNWAHKRIRAQVHRNDDVIATLANTSAILKEYFDYFFWVGFYFFKGDHLLMGPFQGPPACVKLTLDKGVCAAAATKRETILVPDVEQFPGHVACDSRSKSEIVVPVFDNDKTLKAVLDVDSAEFDAFNENDVDGLEKTAELLRGIW